MKILLAGATGFIGKHLTNKLIEEGNQLIILTRNEKIVSISDPNIQYVKWDGLAFPITLHLIDIKAIINLSGQNVSTRWTKEIKEEIYYSRINTTRAIVAAIENKLLKPDVFINASAIGFYGNMPDVLIDERCKNGTGFLASVCVDWEKEALLAIKFGVRVICARFGMVLGEEGALKKMKSNFKIIGGATPGSGLQWVSWVHIIDLVNAINFSLHNIKVEGAVNITTSFQERMRDFCKKLAVSMDKPLLANVPAFVLKIIYGEMASIIMDSQRVFPKKLLENNFEFTFPKLEMALENLRNKQ